VELEGQAVHKALGSGLLDRRLRGDDGGEMGGKQ
jgi:hypothetical protein